MKRIVIVMVIAVSFVGMILLGCGQGGGSSSDEGGVEYYPHTSGHSWQYSTVPILGTYITTFEGTKIVGDVETQMLKTTSVLTAGGSIYHEMYYKITDAAVTSYGSDTPTTETATYLSFPLKVGKSWIYNVTNGDDAIVTVLAKETVTVPAGTFSNCFKISSTRESWGNTQTWEWFAPNVGYIKNCTVTSGVITATLELTSKNF